ncbi:GAF domain-containing protein [Bradyrhizobium sp. th.b2]|uniref:GAF domain-containing protein n=1 Tax=Bradyrhizobium sp. th-b2 TaxID=172088 RepID=UPI001FD8F6F3|nr:GAF domain-containing protein [Bradyrhizobium sp. th.b2]
MYPGLRESNSLLGPTRTIGAPVEQLDLATVLRVSVAVSSEIVPEKVIHTLLHTAIEHAGAERGVLIVPKGGEPRIQGRSGYCRRLGHDRSARLADLWSRNAGAGRALRRAHQENVILDDASTHGTFAGNNYVLRKHTRSILCLPLVKQGNAVALLYLENNLAPRVFTPARVAVLKFLASEAATSLDNALLYRELQDRESRIRRLFDANIIGMHIYNAKGVIALH